MLKYVLGSFLIIIVLCIFLIFFLLENHPTFGGNLKVKPDYKLNYFQDGKFINTSNASEVRGFSKGLKIFWKFIKNNTQTTPKTFIQSKNINIDDIKKNTAIWFGHSSVFLQLEQENILIDPIFSKYAAPFSFVGKKRFSEIPNFINKISFFDKVIISHDHYDHLDKSTIDKIKDRVGMFIVSLGVKNHLLRWGIDESKIQEMEWWESIDILDGKIICTPSQHFSGRALKDRNKSLWASWVIQSKYNIFFSSDSGYNSHFKEIGDKYGPFDLAFIEAGQYNDSWKDIHMLPEESVQVAIDLNTKTFMPIHWGAFTLAMHQWNDSPRRISEESVKKEQAFFIPHLGEIFSINNPIVEDSFWWK